MLTVLRRRGVPALLATSFVGRLPTSMSALALVKLVVAQGGGYAYASVLSASYIVAGIVGQPLLARAVDRTGRRRSVISLAAAIATVSFGATALLVQLPAGAVVAVGVAGLSTPPIEPTLRSLWTQLFSPSRDLASAYAVDAAVQELCFIAGPLLTALGILAFGAKGNVIAMGLVGLAGALALAAHPRLRAVPAPRLDRERAHGTPLGSGAFRRLLLTTTGAAVPVGTLVVLATAFADSHGEAGLGPGAVALNATGALVGALLVARFPLTSAPARLLRPLAIALGVLYLPLAAWQAPSVVWLAAALVSGLTLPPLLTQVFAQTPLTVRAHHANEANAWVVSAFAVGAAAGTLLSGFSLRWHATRGIGLAIGIAVVATLLGAVAAAPAMLTPRPLAEVDSG
ncbi:MFS transporter [Nocardioides mangrovicus]|uniref:MFS transporter n=1 Tax=Nocardioides mangrovicus TaxID=2478913 RepID=A0A3L8P552_9ACTN|nr:MFS transporter [Nocardioides mangrovicus]RLV50264.1 MFS transporter [Nocardioides mangrovicus]